MQRLGCVRLVIQHGSSPCTPAPGSGIEVETFAYKPSLESDLEASDVVICSGGAGTLLECLELGKKILVVPNTTLQDNHQMELIDVLEQEGYLSSSPTCTIADLEPRIRQIHEGSCVVRKWKPPTESILPVIDELIRQRP
ncbi:hypothetical protein HDV03_004929 [Kappamyces sp. JEL0829]|nr:hypothetical protein HDV03_004929 [Kappamyces sp. JEL0829]